MRRYRKEIIGVALGVLVIGLLGLALVLLGGRKNLAPGGGFQSSSSPIIPTDLQSWYGLDSRETGAGQTIAITEISRAPGLVAAVDAFSRRYGLPQVCGTAARSRPCFEFRTVSSGTGPKWADIETELDVEWAHAIAPRAAIVLIALRRPLADVQEVARLARSGGAHVFSSSWCDPCGGPRKAALRADAAWARGCHVAHVVCALPSGDNGAPGVTPSNSPYVLSVGGSLFLRAAGGAFDGQEAWKRSGGGVTPVPLPMPLWQTHTPCPLPHCNERMIPDVSGPSANALATYKAGDGVIETDAVGGTSLATPVWAALIALANQQLAAKGEPAIGIDELHAVLYEGRLTAGLEDITTGSKSARVGWDPVTGLGAPKAGIVDVLVKAIERYRKQP